MTGFELKLWRTGLGWTQERASKEFGISMRTYIRYEHADSDPPRAIELAIQALSLAAMLPDIDALPADTLRQRVRTLAVDIQSG
ncbi:helix-turn-helix domain-containing protein [Serratia marcescens]|uniref:helix-turn-helix domain-containing protein n=1 Tax=Serratia marcescens TaxID=615 RepID=UPI00320486A6